MEHWWGKQVAKQNGDQVVVRVQNLAKSYQINPLRTIWERFSPRRSSKKQNTQIWAIKDIDFEVKKGEIFGLIGPNGAGKSTLLKILCQVTQPTCGSIEVKGRVVPLIEVGAGFHEEMTGLENIYLNGAIMGMTKKEINQNYKSIIEFSELEEFINTPVKKYSSGMKIRLGFSIAVHIEPDILLIDEVLSVGDLGFRLKSQARMKELIKKGVTILFVSHNMNPIRAICHRALFLSRGQMAFGPDHPDKVIEQFQYLSLRKNSFPNLEASQNKPMDNPLVQIRSIRLIDQDGLQRDRFAYNEPFRVQVEFWAAERIDQPSFGIEITREDGIVCIINRSSFHNFDIDYIEGNGFFEMYLDGLYLAPLNYLTRAVICDSTVTIPMAVKYGPSFTISSHIPYSYGLIFPKTKWHCQLEEKS